MKLELSEISEPERTPLVRLLLDIIHQQQQEIARLRDEVARLQGQKPRPQIRPSILHAPTPPGEPTSPTRRRGKPSRPRLSEMTIHRDVPLYPPTLPEGATFKGFEPYVVQELCIYGENTRYLRARFELPDGGSVLAPFPTGVLPVEGGHFGANLVAFVLQQYHQAQVTEPLLLEQLWEYGIDISAGQLHALLTGGKEPFHQEKAEILDVGLTVSSYVGTDDTGARHQGKNGVCTAIGNDLFAYFESTAHKSRLNFLQVLQGPTRTYAVNEMALTYGEHYKLPAALRAQLEQGPEEFDSEEAWTAHLAALAITGERHVRIVTEGALLGGLIARGVSPDLVVLSDGAAQFTILRHAACWVHAERPFAKLVPHNDEHRQALEKVRNDIWELYQALKAYQEQPQPTQVAELEQQFDRLVDGATGYPSIDGPLKEMRDRKADLLRVLSQPEVPLHNNAMESDIREYVKRRKISGGTRSDAGRRCRDTFASLKKTCRKLGVRFWEYLQDRVRGLGQVPRLGELIRQQAQESAATKVEAVPA